MLYKFAFAILFAMGAYLLASGAIYGCGGAQSSSRMKAPWSHACVDDIDCGPERVCSIAEVIVDPGQTLGKCVKKK